MPTSACTWLRGIALLLAVVPATAWADTFIVTSRDDSGLGSLREAVEAANTTTGQHLITFNIPGPGSNSITVNTPLIVSHQTTIDGAGTQVIAGQGTTAIALASGSNGSELRGLAIIGSTLGVLMESGNNRIAGCRIGVDWADNTTTGNKYGILVTGQDNLIGGSTLADRNLVSAQQYYGIQAVGALRLKIQGNYVGTNGSGLGTARNGDIGILLANGATQCLIGGNRSLGEGNLISGNYHAGIRIEGIASSGNSICGNIIGLSVNQTLINSGWYGIIIESSGNRVGLPVPGYENIISGNDQVGIWIESNNNVIQNNLVGLNDSGEVRPNNMHGLSILGYGNHIGGSRANDRSESNVISGNKYMGIEIWMGEGNTICGNFLGTDKNGSIAKSNNTGIYLVTDHNLVGGDQPDYGNVISGNLDEGVLLINGNENTFIGNLIGVSANGDAALPNGKDLDIRGGSGNVIGGAMPGERNVISGKNLQIEHAFDLSMQGNYIGVDSTGLHPFPNTDPTLTFYCCHACMIGGTGDNEKNIICGDAVGLSLTASRGNTIVGNWLGVLADAMLSSGQYQTGIYLDQDSHDNFIGLKGSGQGNLIAASGTGIHACGTSTTRNAFYGNTVCGAATPILLEIGANGEKPAPVIAYAFAGNFQGGALPGDYIEVFKADRDEQYAGGSLRYLGATTANSQGLWFVNGTDLLGGEYVTAIGTDSSNNSSAFAGNLKDRGPTPTATPYTGTAAVDLRGHNALPFPNPAREYVHFFMHLDNPGAVNINVFNSSGERVAAIKENLGAGRGQAITWVCRDIAPGIYFARVSIEGQGTETYKIALLAK